MISHTINQESVKKFIDEKNFSVGTVLAFDFGEKRIGVAVGDLEIGLAHPLVTISNRIKINYFDSITKLIEEWKPVQLIVGLPVHADGTAHKLTSLSRKFAQHLERKFGINTILVDERYTSETAGIELKEAGIIGKKQKYVIDQIAAQQILQSYFDGKNEITRC